MSRSGLRDAWSHDRVATGWNPARFQHAPCPHGCGTLVFLVPKYGTKSAFVSVSKGRITMMTGWSGESFDGLQLGYHDDACAEVAREQRKARALARKLIEERLAAREAAIAARAATIAADPELLKRDERRWRAGLRELEALRRHEAEATKRAQAAAEAAEAAYWREVEAKAERTRQWREANPERARQLNREAQARWRERQKIAKAATAVVVRGATLAVGVDR